MALSRSNHHFRRQESYVSGLFSAYMDGNFKKIAEGQQKIPSSISFRLFGVRQDSSYTSYSRSKIN